MTDSLLITGASTGLGLETAVYLAEQGYKVYATMRDLSRRSSLDEAAAKRNVSLEVLRLDVTDYESIDNAIGTVLDQSGGIYGVINNAGIGLRGFFEDVTQDEVQQIFETNVFGAMAVTRAVLPHMRQAGRGRIVMVNSVGGKLGSMSVSVYCATRFAMQGFAESLYQEVRPLGVYVSLVQPGLVNTEHWSSANRGVAAGALNPESPYYQWFLRSESLVDRILQTSGTTPAGVAKAVHRALSAKKPRLRYLVGRRARLVVGLRRYLPESLFERFYFGAAIRMVTKPDRK